MLIVGAVCALTALVVAFLVDSRTARTRKDILTTPPDQPTLTDLAPPEYLTEETIRTQYAQPADELSPQDRERISAAIGAITPLALGWPSDDFVTDQTTKRAILEPALVLVTEEISRFSDLLPLFRLAVGQKTGLVVVATSLAREVLATVSLNVLAGRLACLCLLSDDLAAVAERCGASVVPATDLTAGWVPDEVLGRVALWVSDASQSWIVPLAD